ncbi:ADP-ribose pyrophosphatase YjhB (NUDIX family) [Pacificibacter maritimus]|uniref:ADP-ribose pyrophosphatase YjhB (NUDIX family) n=1 Tax=Pacificibacter maritimus TaxID=762213 RepID=A0A3N4U7J6_9RHOB|nr:NUDIX hydrolase [Pacificibacter maritimus]RPE66412.1 ADP-ribose pyrophosphatase YjhB (NUDIX family) [Pacificibacter maritimus]
MSVSIPSPRLAVRAIIVHENKLLLVNAYPKHYLGLWCAPGGGVERGASLSENLIREVHEETGLMIDVGPLVLVNEFHDPKSDFHQVDLMFRCNITAGKVDPNWSDVAGVVNKRKWVTQNEISQMTVKPDSLKTIAFNEADQVIYDPLEAIFN